MIGLRVDLHGLIFTGHRNEGENEFAPEDSVDRQNLRGLLPFILVDRNAGIKGGKSRSGWHLITHREWRIPIKATGGEAGKITWLVRPEG